MNYYRKSSKVKHGAPTAEAELSLQGEILVGKFVDRERPDYIEAMKRHFNGVAANQPAGASQ
jgi:2-oxoglutarate ferredoxin oxidoreductase subunit beta